jgi:hypothetical protein
MRKGYDTCPSCQLPKRDNAKTCRRCWTGNKGRRWAAEVKEKFRQAKLQNPVRYWQGKVREQDSGHWGWKGDKVSYAGLHIWVRKHLGTPRKCQHCKNSTLQHRQYHWANKSRQYKRELSDWVRLCVKCHKLYDANKIDA